MRPVVAMTQAKEKEKSRRRKKHRQNKSPVTNNPNAENNNPNPRNNIIEVTPTQIKRKGKGKTGNLLVPTIPTKIKRDFGIDRG